MVAERVSRGLPAVIPGPGGTALEALDGAVAKLKAAATSRATARAYRADWRSWADFAESQKLPVVPADPADVCRYIAAMAKGSDGRRALKARTIERHVTSIAAIHRAQALPFDRDDPGLQRTLAGLRRSLRRRQAGAPALRVQHVREMVRVLGMDARGIRNRALILLGFALGWRRSELVAIDIEDLVFVERGLVVFQPASKTDQEGNGRLVGVVRGQQRETCPVEAVLAWMRLALIEGGTGPLFRSVNRGGGVEHGTRLDGKDVDRVIKEAAKLAGVRPDPIEEKRVGKSTFSAHSFRAGHVTEADESGAVSHWIRRQTGHSSDAMLDRYKRATQILERSSSNYLGL